jgi:hypothetical protein
MSSGRAAATQLLIEIAARRQRSRNVQVRHARAHSAPHRSNDSQNRLVKRIKVAGAADEDVTGDVTPGRHDNAPRRPHRSHISNVHGRRAVLENWKRLDVLGISAGKALGFHHLLNFPQPTHTRRAFGRHAAVQHYSLIDTMCAWYAPGEAPHSSTES